uniref:Uncharacterized protein n=1 Tax=Eutreptiella gymnastica TaxID=73025 RepID=A0A7S1N3Y1_9EUGL|mmetsp:Transcript_116777/g.203135  ORF Transcript_116777/g.203135 Transcript_116777/m.203135 type:complete len:642 (+) Transcript_116777:128-2053(+)
MGKGTGADVDISQTNHSGKSVEELMQKLTTTNVAKSTPMPKKALKQEIEDCLDETGKEKKAHPEFTKREIKKIPKGFSFGTAPKGDDKMFYTADLSTYMFLGKESPGPCYHPASPEPHKAQSIPKAGRMKDKALESTPGPQYDVPGSIGRQIAKESAPSYKMGQSQRFNDNLYISSAHSKSMTNSESPAPNSYSLEETASGPAFSFTAGSRDVSASGKLFISRAHSEREGIGNASPGPMYTWSSEVTHKRSPAYTMASSERVSEPPRRARSTPPGGAASDEERRNRNRAHPRFISREHAKLEPGKDSPGPGAYSPDHKSHEKETPHHTFGVNDSHVNRFISRDLVHYGHESPGPKYKPNEKHIKKRSGAAIFANSDPNLSALMPRFPENQYIGSHKLAAEAAGRTSPGPAAYTPVIMSEKAPAYTMARKEKVLVKRICPGPERSRYISKEMSQENLGAYSPGPKYKMPDCIGNQYSIKYSMGMSDRAFEDIAVELKEKHGTIEKPYTAPSEARFYGALMQKHSMLGKYSPGPKYMPDDTCVAKKVPAHAMAGRWKSTDVRPTKEEYDEERKRVKARGPQRDITAASAPKVKFGTSKRGLLKGEDKSSKTNAHGRDSPGPVYRPNFEAVSKHKPSTYIGGLH